MRKEPLGKVIDILSKTIKKTIDNNLEKYNTTMEQSRFLIFLGKNNDRPIFQNDFCDAFSLTKGSVSTLLNTLESNNLISRHKGNDRRLNQIKLTKNGITLLSYIKIELDKMETQLVKGFTSDEQELVYGIIEKLLKNIKDDKL